MITTKYPLMTATETDQKEKRREVRKLLDQHPAVLFAILALRPDLRDLFRGTEDKGYGNRFLISSIPRSANEWLPRTLGVFKQALEYGANPYAPQNLLLEAARLHLINEVVARKFLLGMVMLGVDVKCSGGKLLKLWLADPLVVLFLLNNGCTWQVEHTTTLLGRRSYGMTFDTLCSTGKIYSFKGMMRQIFQPCEVDTWPTNLCDNANTIRAYYASLLAYRGIPVPARWLRRKCAIVFGLSGSVLQWLQIMMRPEEVLEDTKRHHTDNCVCEFYCKTGMDANDPYEEIDPHDLIDCAEEEGEDFCQKFDIIHLRPWERRIPFNPQHYYRACCVVELLPNEKSLREEVVRYFVRG